MFGHVNKLVSVCVFHSFLLKPQEKSSALPFLQTTSVCLTSQSKQRGQYTNSDSGPSLPLGPFLMFV